MPPEAAPQGEPPRETAAPTDPSEPAAPNEAGTAIGTMETVVATAPTTPESARPNNIAADFAPMPEEAPPGLLTTLPYFFQVMQARFKRSGAIRGLDRNIKSAQQLEQQALQQLGKAARQREQPLAVAKSELRAVLALEQQREAAHSARAELDCQLQEHEQTFAATEADCKQRTESIEARITHTRSALTERHEQQSALRARLSSEEKQLRTLKKARDDTQAQANKKQGDAQQEVLERLAAEKGVQIGDWEKQRAVTIAENEQLQQPIEQLNAELQDQRNQLQDTSRELAGARQQLAATKRQIHDKRREQTNEIEKLDNDIANSLVELGRAVDLHRGDASDFEGLFGVIDEHRNAISGHEQQIRTLDAQRNAYDHNAYKRGQLILLAIVGGGIMIIIAVALLLAT